MPRRAAGELKVLYPQDYEVEAPKSEWWVHRPTARAVASRIDRWERGNVLAAAIILIDPGACGLAREWAKMIERRKPYEVDCAIKAERQNPVPRPARGYSADLPKIRDKPETNPETAMADFFAVARSGTRGI